MANYSTTFPSAPESPLSEAGAFTNTVSATWNHPVTSNTGPPNHVIGLGSATTNDAVAMKTGTWGPNQIVNGTVWRSGGASPSSELELHTRMTMTPGSPDQITTHEFDVINNGNSLQPVTWNGTQGSFTVLGGGWFIGGLVDGDVLTCSSIGVPASTVHEGKLNGTSLGTFADSAGLASGNPGIGLDDQGDGGTFGWKGWSATDGISGAAPRPLPRARPQGEGPFLKPWIAAHAFRQNIAPAATPVGIVTQKIGAYTWSGVPTLLLKLVQATPGAWTWKGTTSPLSKEIVSTPGTWTWKGNASPISKSIAATKGAWTWAGVPTTISASIASRPGVWTWAGTHASFIGPINAAPAAWTWAGLRAPISTSINAIPGAWRWAALSSQVTVPGASTPSNLYPHHRRVRR